MQAAAHDPAKWHDWLQRDVPPEKRRPYKPETTSSSEPKKVSTAKNVVPFEKKKDNGRMSRSELNDLLKKNPKLKIRGAGVKEEMSNETIRRVLSEAVHKKGGGKKGIGSKGQESEGDNHPIATARRVLSLGLSLPFKHTNKDKSEMEVHHARSILTKYDNLTKPHEKEHMIKQVWGSSQGMHDYIAGKIHKPKVHWAMKGIKSPE